MVFLIGTLSLVILYVLVILYWKYKDKKYSKNYTFDAIRKNGQLLYEYVRGSFSYGLNVETSDRDTGGIFIADTNMIKGLRANYIEQISDEKHDNVWYEVGRFLELLIKSNPTMLESLYVPADCILYEHPIMSIVKNQRDKFLTRDTLMSLSGYAIEQIKKARGYNKLCAYPENMKRKQPLDFCYTFNEKQGTMPISKWLENRGLKQIYCGLNHLPNMEMMFGVFYDWGQHLHMEFKDYHEAQQDFNEKETNGHTWFWDKLFEVCDNIFENEYEWETSQNRVKTTYELCMPKGYHGIVKEDGKSTMVHLDSIKNGDTPICHMSYSKDGYTSHCTLYKRWSEWKKVRNKVRYESNFGTGYDSKNMMHCIRLLTMAVELAQGKGFIMDRRVAGDREFLLDIRNHKYDYNYLIEYAEKKKAELDEAMKTCTLPEHVDPTFVNDILITIRDMFLDREKYF